MNVDYSNTVKIWYVTEKSTVLLLLFTVEYSKN